MRRTPVIAALLALAIPATAAAADPQPGTARFAAPARGDVAVIPTDGSFANLYLPFAAGKREFLVYARLPAGVRARGLLVKHGPAGRRCAATFRGDRGTALPVAAGGAEGGGWVTVRTAPRRWALLGRHRFCVWPVTGPGRTARPLTQVIRFFGAGIGAVQWADRNPDGTAGVVTEVISTSGFRYSSTVNGCPERPANPERDAAVSTWGLARLTGINPYDTRCNHRNDLAVSSSADGPFTLTLLARDAEAGVVRHGGSLCALAYDWSTRPDDARRLVEAQGCRVGRTLRARSSEDLDLPDWVWAFTVNGADAPLVPRGTTVDLVVNARPR
ncbi:MAG: hypothetical protein U0237_17585 [Thermoleophilia bacterium]